jgi:hypothetical protein
MRPWARGLGPAGLPTPADPRTCCCLPCLPAAIASPRLPACLPTCRKFRSPRLERVQREAVFKRLLDRCKRVRQCPLCGKGGGVGVHTRAHIDCVVPPTLPGVRARRAAEAGRRGTCSAG